MICVDLLFVMTCAVLTVGCTFLLHVAVDINLDRLKYKSEIGHQQLRNKIGDTWIDRGEAWKPRDSNASAEVNHQLWLFSGDSVFSKEARITYSIIKVLRCVFGVATIVSLAGMTYCALVVP